MDEDRISLANRNSMPEIQVPLQAVRRIHSAYIPGKTETRPNQDAKRKSWNGMVEGNQRIEENGTTQWDNYVEKRDELNITPDRGGSRASLPNSSTSSFVTPTPSISQSWSSDKLEDIITLTAQRSVTMATELDSTASKIARRQMATEKKHEEFHALFKKIEETETLIADYRCAFQKDILVHGRMYVTSKHVCFYASIFGWATQLTLPFADIIAIEKKMTAFVIPNAIQISTLYTRYFFASFVVRDQTYNQLVLSWKNTQKAEPMNEEDLLTQEEALLKGNGLKESVFSADASDVPDFDEFETSKPSSTIEETEIKKELPMPVNDTIMKGSFGSTVSNVPVTQLNDVKKKNVCLCTNHFKWIILDHSFPISVNILHSLIFADDSKFIQFFLESVRQCKMINFAHWSMKNGNQEAREIIYMMPIKVPFKGTVMTKAIQNEVYKKKQDNAFYVIDTETYTPEVPSGDSFLTCHRYCLTSLGPKESHLMISGTVKFSKSSWIRSLIEKSSLDGSSVFICSLGETINQWITEKGLSSEADLQKVLVTPTLDSQQLGIDRLKDKTMVMARRGTILLSIGQSRHSLHLLIVLFIALVVNIKIFLELANMENNLNYLLIHRKL